MNSPSIINQNEERNRTVGSNPTPSESYHYNDLQRVTESEVIPELPKRHYQQVNFNKRGGYNLGPDAYVWHPDPAVRLAWSRQVRGEQ